MPPTNHPTPRLIATIGLHGSGSTWAFNIVRELVRHASGSDPVSFYADAIAELPPQADDDTRWRVLKSHHGSAELDTWLTTAAPLLLTIRDPRDAALSMHQRFAVPLIGAVQMVFNDCRHLHSLRTRPGHLLLRYESGFFRGTSAIHAIAAWLGLPIDTTHAEALAQRYTPEATRAFAADLVSLPPDRTGHRGEHGRFDRLTNIHDVHIGDMRSGKWRDLPAGLQADITRIFRPHLEAFGY